MPEKEQAGAELQLLVFELDSQPYAVDISGVVEVVRMQAVLRAREPVAADGFISLRGRVIPVVELRSRLGLPQGRRTDAQRVVVVEAGAGEIGMVVDAVTEACRVGAETVESPEGAPEHVSGMLETGGRKVSLVDIAKLFPPDEAERLAAASKAA